VSTILPQRITENRIPFWSHVVVPEYLRTKVDPGIVIEHNRALSSQAGSSRVSSNPDALQKIINQMNKACSAAYDLLTAASKDELDVEGALLQFLREISV